MTVAELIEKLKEMPQDLEVMTEGCDCDGDVADVTFQQGRGLDPDYVYLRRSR